MPPKVCDAPQAGQVRPLYRLGRESTNCYRRVTSVSALSKWNVEGVGSRCGRRLFQRLRRFSAPTPDPGAAIDRTKVRACSYAIVFGDFTPITCFPNGFGGSPLDSSGNSVSWRRKIPKIIRRLKRTFITQIFLRNQLPGAAGTVVQ
jgi:hypothetical protein